LSKYLAWRQEWCDRVGLGFSLVGPRVLQKIEQTDSDKAA
jgi:hypothetical protein